MNERTENLGRRQEYREKRAKIVTTCEALRAHLRRLLPVDIDPAEIDRDAVLDTAASLHTELGDLAVLDKKLAVVERELGI